MLSYRFISDNLLSRIIQKLKIGQAQVKILGKIVIGGAEFQPVR
jgi:hypothetical protein